MIRSLSMVRLLIRGLLNLRHLFIAVSRGKCEKSFLVSYNYAQMVMFLISIRDLIIANLDKELQEIFQQSKSLLGSGQISQGLQNIMRGIWYGRKISIKVLFS